MKRAWPIAALVLVLGCDNLPDPGKSKGDIETLVKQFHEAYDRLETEPILAMCDPAVTWSAAPTPTAAGKESVGSALRLEINALRDRGAQGKLSTRFGQIRIDVTGRCAVATYSALSIEDKHQADFLYALVFYRSEGEWRLIHATRAPGRPVAEMTDAPIEIENLVKRYHEAYDAADEAAVLDLLDPEVAISRPPIAFLQGRDACAAQLKKDLQRLRDGKLVGQRSTAFERIRIEVDRHLAVATYAANIREGSVITTSIFTRVFRFSDKRWRIFREHYSIESK